MQRILSIVLADSPVKPDTETNIREQLLLKHIASLCMLKHLLW